MATTTSNVNNAPTLGALSRSVINRNVKREDIDSLPLPSLLKDECFFNVATDRCKEHFQRQSFEPCHCCKFSKNLSHLRSRIIRWSEKAKSKCGAHFIYFSELPGLPTNAEWLTLPDRKTLLELYNSTKSKYKRKCFQACLNTLRFHPTTGLGRVHEWIYRYLFYQYKHGWYYVSVCAGSMNSFLETMKHFDVVLLPYGCVSGGGSYKKERMCLAKNWRRMILVVKDDDDKFQEAMETVKNFRTKRLFGNSCMKIRDPNQFAETISYVSRPDYLMGGSFFDKNYFIFEPMIRHAYWWMLLLIPHGYVKNNYGRPIEMKVQNCVVLLDPLNQCMGDVIKTYRHDCPYVYWYDGKILNVKKITNVFHDTQIFVNWCAERNMNTLMNLNGNSWFLPTIWFHCNEDDWRYSSGDECCSMSEYESDT